MADLALFALRGQPGEVNELVTPQASQLAQSREINSDDVIIAPGGPNPGTSLTDELNALASNTGGRIFLELYHADGTYERFDAAGVLVASGVSSQWSPQPEGSRYYVWVVPGGTGGSRSGRSNAAVGTDLTGSSAPGGGAVADYWFDRQMLEAYIALIAGPIPIAVGAGGPGAPALASGTGLANSAIGTLGGTSTFGGLVTAYPGGRGSAAAGVTNSSEPGAGGGGWFNRGEDSDTGTSDQIGGGPVVSPPPGGRDADHGGGRGYNTATGAASASLRGGGGGGGSAGSGALSSAGGRSAFGVPGAGCGGSLEGTGPVARAGGDAGGRGLPTGLGESPVALVGGGPVGSAGVVGSGTSSPGADGLDGIIGMYPGESGAGSGGMWATTGAGGTGRGGDGGFPGGCGGTSGVACSNGGINAVSVDRGGNGADGVVAVITY